jgi:ketosteroid isomerase-like protein
MTKDKAHATETTAEESVRRFFDDWLEAERAENIGSLMQMIDDHCVFLLPGQEPLKGKAAVRAMYEQFFQAYRGSVDRSSSVNPGCTYRRGIRLFLGPR